MITYETLKSAQRQERKTNSLTKLSQNFFAEAQEYIQAKQEFIAELSGSGRDFHIHELELKNAREILAYIYDRRERKLLNLALSSIRGGITHDNLLGFEKELLTEIASILSKGRAEILHKTPGRQPMENVKKEKIEMKRVKFAGDFPSFLGIDEKEYGPFKAGRIVELPKPNAEILIGKSKACEVTED